MNEAYIQNWPETLKIQLTFSKSHTPLFDSVGPAKAFVGIFELFSRTPLPPQCRPVMSRIPPLGSPELEESFGKPGESATLSGYSFVVVAKALQEFPKNYRTGIVVRQFIHECMHEALKFDLLIHDVTTAARTLARLKLKANSSHSPPKKPTYSSQMNFKWIEEFESLTDRPQDWKSSHWWTGE